MALTARHEILATGCIYAPAKASILFCWVAYFAAFDFFFDELDFAFAGDFDFA